MENSFINKEIQRITLGAVLSGHLSKLNAALRAILSYVNNHRQIFNVRWLFIEPNWLTVN